MRAAAIIGVVLVTLAHRIALALDVPQSCPDAIADSQVESDEEVSLLMARSLRRDSPKQAAADASATWSFAEVSAGPPPGAAPKVFVGIKSAPQFMDRRSQWRASGCPKRLLAAGIQYAFVVGVPNDQGHVMTGHDQAAKDTDHERKLSQLLLEEAEREKDIVVIPERDAYQDLSDKTLHILLHSYETVGAEYLAMNDDEYCAEPGPLLAAIAKHEAKDNNTELYAGAYMFRGTEYLSMRGPHNETAEYFGGHSIILSRGLLKLIVGADRAHSILSAPYGTQSEDANVGKWVRYAKEKHGVAVDVVVIPDLLNTTLKEPPKP